MPGGDTTKNRWTEHELALAARGEVPEGRTPRQTASMRAKLKRQGVDVGWGSLIGAQPIYEA